MKQKNNITSGFVTLIFAVVAVFGSIAGLKQCTGRYNVVQSNDTLPMAHPVTSLDPEIIPEPADTVVQNQPADTIIGKDPRPAGEAGYEDGYIDGMDDGSEDEYKQSYDESNIYTTATEQKAYITNYSEGYEKGFADARSGKHFNI